MQESDEEKTIYRIVRYGHLDLASYDEYLRG